MSKTKSKGSRGASKPEADILTKTKDMGVTKPSKTAKSQSKDIAKKVAKKQEKLQKERKVKEPTPESSDSSESDSDSDDEMSDSGIGLGRKAALKGAAKSNGVNKARPAGFDDSSDDSDIDSPSSASSDDEATAKPNVKKAAAVEKSKAVPDESDDSDEPSDSDSSEDEGAKVKSAAVTKGKPAAAVVSKGSLQAKSDEDSDEASDKDSSDSSDVDSVESDAESYEEVKTKTQQKRKAEEDTSRLETKKSKVEADENVTTSPNLFVGQLSWNVDDEWLQREFEEFGELAGVRVVTDRDSGRSKGFGYVEFVKAADAANALAAKNNAEIDGRRIRLDFSIPRQKPANFQDRAQSRAKSFGDQTSPASDTLFVGNISFEATQDNVTEAFSDYGTIMGVRLPTDRETGAPKGFGYVTFSTVDEATAALKGAQGIEVAGRPLRLDFSTPRPDNGNFNSRGGRGGRGGGGRGFGRGGFGDRGGSRGGRGGGRGGRGGSTNRGGFGDFSGRKTTF